MSKPVLRAALALVVGTQLVLAAPARAQTATETAPATQPEAAAPTDPATAADPAVTVTDPAATPADPTAQPTDPASAPADTTGTPAEPTAEPATMPAVEGADENAPPPLTGDPNAPSATAEQQTNAEAAAAPAAAPAAPAVAPAPEPGWGWLSVAGWASLAVGTIGVVIGAVTLANPSDFYAITADRRITPNSVFGFGSLVAGAALALVGGVLLYLDTALN